MEGLLKANGAENTQVLNGDFLKLNVLDKRFSKVGVFFVLEIFGF